MEEQTAQLDQNISTILDNYELSPQKFNQAHLENTLFIKSDDFSTESSSRASHKAIVTAQIQRKVIILELDFAHNENITNTLELILPLCHVIMGKAKDFKIATRLEPVNAALQTIRDKSYAILALKQEKGDDKIFDRLDTIQI